MATAENDFKATDSGSEGAQSDDSLGRRAREIIAELALNRGSDDDEEDYDDDEEDDVSPEDIEAMEKLEVFVKEKMKGALAVDIINMGPMVTRIVAYGFRDNQHDPDPVYPLDDPDRGFVQPGHSSFESYRRTKFFTNTKGRPTDTNIELNTFLDVESDPRYENANLGTVTIEGFGAECWEYEEFRGSDGFQMPDWMEATLNSYPVPPAYHSQLLRRVDQLKGDDDAHKIGVDPEQDERDLREFVGDAAMKLMANDPDDKASVLIRLIDRKDVATEDFSTVANIVGEWRGSLTHEVNFMRQIVFTKELARRLPKTDFFMQNQFSSKVYASLIIIDLWLRNVEMAVQEQTRSITEAKQLTPTEQEEADSMIKKAEEAMAGESAEEAINLFREAIAIDSNNTSAQRGLCEALSSQKRHEEQLSAATSLAATTPGDPNAWTLLGKAQLEYGNAERAIGAYKRALELAGEDSKSTVAAGLAEAEQISRNLVETMEAEQDPDKKDALRKKILDQKWDPSSKAVVSISKVQERQIEGLIYFAKAMKWPHLEEACQQIPKAYALKNSNGNLHDWMFGLTLPGKWFAVTLMASLVACTPSTGLSNGPDDYNCGLVLPDVATTYWRVRTSLGRVLGTLPGLVSQNGWIGPCPNVELDPPVPESEKGKARWIALQSRPVPHNLNKPTIYDEPDAELEDVLEYDGEQEIKPYIEEIQDTDNWSLLAPPHASADPTASSSCELKSIRLKRVISTQEAEADNNTDEGTEYDASIDFQLTKANNDTDTTIVTFNLKTIPVFVTCPPCYPSNGKGHEIHTRQEKCFTHRVWTLEDLCSRKDTDEDGEGVIVIDATSKGAEALARAWCAEQGKSAVIRREGGPCYGCSIRAAGKAMKVGVLIWVS
ncbi:hypothetical protein FQN53_003721 [Emmonsiellopsis sp. PD_33]|nr:hypothetical protein FQN53_003721 [Emmonsiellopsis sp. PD_33]